VTPRRSLRWIAAALGVALVTAVAATAAPRDLDRSFGGDGIVLTPVGSGQAQGQAVARQTDGKLVVAGDAMITGNDVSPNGVALARYLPGGRLDGTFGGGDGVVVEQFDEEGTGGKVVAIQPDGKVLVAGQLGCCIARLYVARYLADGTRDPSFGTAGVAKNTPPVCCDGAQPTGLALDSKGRIVVSGWIHNTFTAESFVARLTSDGHPDTTYAGDGISTLHLGDAEEQSSFANAMVLQGDRAVIAGHVLRSTGHSDLMLARLDETGELDETFGEAGVVMDHVDAEETYDATDVALWNGKLIVTGTRFRPTTPPTQNYLLARFDATDGALDETFNGEGTDPGHVFAGAGDGNPRTDGLAVNQATGAATVVGSADEDGKRKLLVARYTSEGTRDDAAFRSSDGHFGARLIDAGGSQTLGHDVLLDGTGKIVAAGAALTGGRFKFLLARLGDTPRKPNVRPVARIRGHHVVPRKRWMQFHGRRSFDTDGRIVDYAWRTGDRPFRSLGPVFWHRFGRRGVHVVSLRVRDDRGAVDVATFRVHVRTRAATDG
jgi:uncharacterized delta-60 repeat protein